MIEWKKTSELNVMGVEECKVYFDKYPKSDKKIVVICDNPDCRKVRIITKSAYCSLCNSCSKKKKHTKFPKRGTYPELKCVDEEETFKQFGYYSTQLKEKSGKSIMCICDNPECKKLRIVRKSEYRDLCWKCAQEKNYNNSENIKIRSEAQKKRFEDIEERNKTSKGVIQYYIDHPEEGERHSARLQGQDYDNGEWTGYTDKRRPYLVPKYRCIHLNPKFEGCIQHHIMTGVIINILPDLHKSIKHKMSTKERKGYNIKEINKLAFDYLLGRI